MLRAGLFVVGLLCGGCSQAPANDSVQDPADGIELFTAACVGTTSDKARLAELAERSGWAPLPFSAGPGGPDWGLGYDLSWARVMLAGRDHEVRRTDPSGRAGTQQRNVVCAVDARTTPSDWETRLADEADRLDLAPSGVPISAMRPDVRSAAVAKIWGEPGRRVLLAYERADGTFVVEMTTFLPLVSTD
ncbi:hypothetical protein [Brevundimonas sp.]|jgi:hypothetical protein|uniref:hypothetical protein n=1 Tax=Brevundimonas sp. TaxID=1871086 RepID=UPI002E0E4617|nr:hypothetical protein [Brevundimonas sp.]